MSDKCEWKKGKVINGEGDHRLVFEPCEGFNGLTFQGGRPKENNCIVCHSDIRKPEPDQRVESENDFIIRLMRESLNSILKADIDYNYLNTITGGKLNMIKDRIFPEPPKPLIVKDAIRGGDTWVISENDIDYIYTGKNLWLSDSSFPYLHKGDNINNFIYPDWKSFTGDNPDITELTDDIAKLRPMVRHKDGSTTPIKLYGIEENQAIFIPPMSMFTKNIRLATAKELQDIPK